MKSQLNYFLPEFFYSVELPNHKELKEEIYSTLLEMDAENAWTLCNAKTTFRKDNEFLFNNKNLTQSIWKAYDQLLEEDFIKNAYAYTFPSQSHFDRLWFNSYEEGTFQEVHNHCGGLSPSYSVVYLIHDESDTGLVFSSSNRLITNYTDVRYAHTKDFGIGEGSIIFFPSYVDHYVLPTTGKRATISGNITSSS